MAVKAKSRRDGSSRNGLDIAEQRPCWSGAARLLGRVAGCYGRMLGGAAMALKAFDLTKLGLYHWEVDLDWKRPREISGDDASIFLPEEAFEIRGIYRFIREHHLHGFSGGMTERIGIAYNQSIGKRVSQYTGAPLAAIRNRGQLSISYAFLDFEGQDRRQRYEDVEHILCFFVQPVGNDKKTRSLPADAWYRIKNRGSRGDLPKEIVFPALMADE
jgi:hypothetical protein